MPIQRFDQINLDELKLQETEEGFLQGFAIATRTGVFKYMKNDGSIQRELRLPEEVFSEESINSFKMKPITNEHKGLVNSENAKNFTVGMTGQEVKIDGTYFAPFITITDKSTIDEIKRNKKQGLSFGYNLELEKQDGVYNGEPYNYIQRKIRGNHLAIVHQGRAGSKARINLDADDAICVNNNFNENFIMPKKINLDNKEFEVAEEIALKLDSLVSENSELKKQNKEIQNNLDSVNGKLDASKTELEALKKQDNSDQIKESVKNRIILINKAQNILKNDEDLLNLSDREIQEKVILKIQPDAKFDAKSDEYISARFDTIVEFEKNNKISKHFEIASNKTEKNDSEEELDFSSQALQARLINNPIK